MNKIKINLLSHGRFHMVDLTRELKKQGFDVKLYSFVPPKMCKKYGLCNEDFYSLFYILAHNTGCNNGNYNEEVQYSNIFNRLYFRS